MSLQTATLYEFIRQRGLGVVSTVFENGAPEAALVNIASTPDLQLIFHAIQTTRKCSNLRRDPRIAVVIGWDSDKSLQCEGIADEPREPELRDLKKVYFESCPNGEGRSGWPGLTYFRVRPRWIRFSSYTQPWSVEEITF